MNFEIYPDSTIVRKTACHGAILGFVMGMICAGFLSPADRADLTALARDGSAAHRLARRANALVLLDSGWSCEKVAGANWRAQF